MIANREFRVRIGSEYSNIFSQENGVPQGSVISPTLFMILINDLLSKISPHVKYALYADDIVLWCNLRNIEDAKREMQRTLKVIEEWQLQWGTTFSTSKSNYMLFSRKRKIPRVVLTLNNTCIPSADTIFFLGLKFDRKLSWNAHIKYLKEACLKKLNVMRSLQHAKWGADRQTLLLFYKTYIRAKLDYGCHLYDSAITRLKNSLNTVQNSALRLATGTIRTTNIKRLEVEADIPSLQLHRDYLSFNYGLKIVADVRHPTRPYVVNHRPFEDSPSKPFSRRLFELGTKYDIPILNVDHLCNFNIPPWSQPNFNINTEVHTGFKAQLPIEMLHWKSMRAIDSFPDTVHIYTDGSVKGERTGIGIFNNNYSKCLRLPNHTSIFTAEAYAILKALQYALEIKRDTTVFTDSYSCIVAVKTVSKHPIITRIQNTLQRSDLNLPPFIRPSYFMTFYDVRCQQWLAREISFYKIK